ncbi:hypothetical protein [Staphylococcus succinus]|nr:hypothetical protein [Staphylococcus succinus]
MVKVTEEVISTFFIILTPINNKKPTQCAESINIYFQVIVPGKYRS